MGHLCFLCKLIGCIVLVRILYCIFFQAESSQPQLQGRFVSNPILCIEICILLFNTYLSNILIQRIKCVKCIDLLIGEILNWQEHTQTHATIN